MLDACKACGWSRVFWRTLDGGRSLYASKLVRPEFKMETDNIWDPQTNARNSRASRPWVTRKMHVPPSEKFV